MQVSREYIETNELVNFEKDRFILLDVEAYLGLLGVVPIAPQIALINALNDPKHRFVVAALSRRTGKNYCRTF